MMAISRSRGPRGPDRIADIEQNTGRELPPAYRDLVMATGGGICHPGMRVRFRKMQVRGRTVTRILGNGVLGDGAENSLDSAAVRDLVPDFQHHFICALTETPSQWFIILRDRTLFPLAPAGAVALFDDEHRVFYRVASSFAGFLGKLERDATFVSAPTVDSALVDEIHRALEGLQVSCDQLQTACDRSMAKSGALTLGKGRWAEKLRDFIFVMITRTRPVQDLRGALYSSPDELSFSTVVPWLVHEFGHGFPVEGTAYLREVEKWFTTRVVEETMVRTSDGYRLTPEEEQQVAASIRASGYGWY